MKTCLLTIALLTHTLFTFSQGGGVGINDTGAMPDTSAILDISSSNKGLLIPRLSLTDTADVTTISGATTSLIVHNTNAAMTGGNGTGLYQWNGNKWIKLIAPENGPGNDGEVLTSQGTGKAAAWKTGGGSSSGCTVKKRVFITSTTYDGNLGGAAGADSKCQVRADAASLGGTWKAIISENTINQYARARIGYDWDILVDILGRSVIASTKIWTGATGEAVLNVPIEVDEFGNFVTTNGTWTSTRNDGGALGANCSNWTSTSGNGVPGIITSTYQWIGTSQAACTQLKRLYCVEQ